MKLFYYKHRILSICLVSFIIALITCLISSPAFACSGVYVGCNASSDGTSMIARSSDTSVSNQPCYFKVFGGKDGEKLVRIESDNGFVYDLPENIFRFTVLSTCDVVDSDSYFTTATNEYGVSISATLTAYVCKEALEADPFVDGGIVEDKMPAVVGACCKTAREGIELLAKIIDEKGSGGNEIVMISDNQECWYMEMYAGHQYCAVKAPDDCVCAMGNEFMLETIDGFASSDVICSKDLFSLPQQKGYAKYNSNGSLNLFNTYSGENRFTDYCHLRTWRAHSILSPSTIGNYEPKTKYPIFFKPDKKVSLNDVMSILRDRYEGTQYCPDTTNRDDIRPIGDDTQLHAHILQTYKNLPQDMSVVLWQCLSPAEFSTFVPMSSIESKFDPSYTYNIPSFQNDENNASLCFKKLNTIVQQNKSLLGDGVKSYWNYLEKYYQAIFPAILEQASNDKSKAQNLIDNFCCNVQNQSYYDAKRLINECEWCLMNNQHTYKHKMNLSTFAVKELVIENYSPLVDAVLFAKINGWNIIENKLQDHPGVYNNNMTGNESQADNGGKEGYLKIEKDGTTVEIHSNNGHALSIGKLLINGSESEIAAQVKDGKTYVDFTFLDKISSNNFSIINNEDLSSNRNFEQNFSLFGSLGNIPLWIQIIIIVFTFIVCIVIGFCISRAVSKRKNI
ncbi:MAG: C69 family dipeptidase [Coriobacteriia bacterium]|nr:C69 family dipeptidase [Coriobacteriia bacterium]